MDERVAKLLLKAIRSLPEREQTRVLADLICAAIVAPGPEGRLVPDPAATGDVMLIGGPPPVLGATMEMAPGPSTMLPIRLPPDLHDRLRQWSTEHGFSMAGVVRGLVERFLDEQSGRAVPKRPTARARTKPPSRPKRSTARG